MTSRPISSSTVAVVGSANLDVVVPVDRHPNPGETVLGGDHLRASGGKGANQAVAAARLGADVAFVGAVGDDEPGRELLDAMVRAGVDVQHLRRLDGVPSGMALITVDPQGENAIVVSPGANARLGVQDVYAAGDLLRSSDAVLLQLEIPLDAVRAAAELARGTVILNPAPAAKLPAELLDAVDVIVPNRTELALLTDRPVPATLTEVERALQALPRPHGLVVTLGADGAMVRDAHGVHHLPSVPVAAVDATAAGDAFCGALAVALLGGARLVDAAQEANAAAAIAVTRHGAQPSLPSRTELAEVLAREP